MLVFVLMAFAQRAILNLPIIKNFSNFSPGTSRKMEQHKENRCHCQAGCCTAAVERGRHLAKKVQHVRRMLFQFVFTSLRSRMQSPLK